jgi:hypothetical protein
MLQRGKTWCRPQGMQSLRNRGPKHKAAVTAGGMEKNLPPTPIPAPIPATGGNRSSVQAAGAAIAELAKTAVKALELPYPCGELVLVETVCRGGEPDFDCCAGRTDFALFSGILPDSSRPGEKNSGVAAGLIDTRFTHESGCPGLSKVQTDLRTRGRAYYQAFIKKL